MNLDEYKKMMYEAFDKKDYDKYIEMFNEYMKMSDEPEYKVLYLMSRAYFHKQDNQMSLKYARKSLKIHSTDGEYVNSTWQLARCYGFSDIERNLYYTEECIKICRDKEELRKNLPDLLNNLGYYSGDKKYLFEALDLLKELKIARLLVYDAVCDSLATIYIKENNFFMANKYIKKISDLSLKTNLRNKMIEQSKIANIL